MDLNLSKWKLCVCSPALLPMASPDIDLTPNVGAGGIKARISAFETMSTVTNSHPTSSTTSSSSTVTNGKSPSSSKSTANVNILDTPNSPPSTYYTPIMPSLVPPAMATASKVVHSAGIGKRSGNEKDKEKTTPSPSPSPSPPILGRKTSLIDLKDWIIDDIDPTASPTTSPKKKMVTPLIHLDLGSPPRRPSPSPSSAYTEVQPRSRAPSVAGSAPPLPPRKLSYTSLKSVSVSDTGSTTSFTSTSLSSHPSLPSSLPRSPLPSPINTAITTRKKSDSLTVDQHTYPPFSSPKFGGGKGGHVAGASSISSFHSVSLSSDGGSGSGFDDPLAGFVATYPGDLDEIGSGKEKDGRRESDVKEGNKGAAEKDDDEDSFENVSIVGSPLTTVSTTVHDWSEVVKRKVPPPPPPVSHSKPPSLSVRSTTTPLLPPRTLSKSPSLNFNKQDSPYAQYHPQSQQQQPPKLPQRPKPPISKSTSAPAPSSSSSSLKTPPSQQFHPALSHSTSPHLPPSPPRPKTQPPPPTHNHPPPIHTIHSPVPPPSSYTTYTPYTPTHSQPPSNRSSLNSTISSSTITSGGGSDGQRSSRSSMTSVLSSSTTSSFISVNTPKPSFGGFGGSTGPSLGLGLGAGGGKLNLVGLDRRYPPIPPSALKRYEAVFVGNVIANRHSQKSQARLSSSPKSKKSLGSPEKEKSNNSLLAPPALPAARKGWRGLSVDLITSPGEGGGFEDKTSVGEEKEKEKEKGKGEEVGGTVGDDERLDAYIVKLVWKCSGLRREKLKDIWVECDPNGIGSLDKSSFCKGMWRIDEELRKARQASIKALSMGGFSVGNAMGLRSIAAQTLNVVSFMTQVEKLYHGQRSC
ncbi:hypothetical protein ABKN59_001460 [Abortiporus biennis]